MEAGEEELVCCATLAAVAAWAIARQITPTLRKANVPRGEVLREFWRERRRRKRRVARPATRTKRRNARTATTTCSAKTARTVAETELRDIGGDRSSRSSEWRGG